MFEKVLSRKNYKYHASFFDMDNGMRQNKANFQIFFMHKTN